MESKKISSKDVSANLPLVCLVCGDIARGLNFDVITCMSCKAFFRRNALRKSGELQCPLDNTCIITQQTRAGCSACRLKKCFDLGMNSNLIRSTFHRSPSKSNDQATPPLLPSPTISNSTLNDRLILTFDEWNLLSNILQAYDEQNLIVRTQNALQEQLSLPPKFRSKISLAFDITSLFYTSIQPFLERLPYFHKLPSETRQMLLRNNLHGTGTFNSMFAASEAKVFDYDYYIGTCEQIYGADCMKEVERFIARRELNINLMKIMLVVLSFSSNCSIILPDLDFDMNKSLTSNSIDLIRTQDIFIVLLWKYLVYQYGFSEAVRRLDNLVKYYLDLLNRMSDITNQQHLDMIEDIIRKTTESLHLEN